MRCSGIDLSPSINIGFGAFFVNGSNLAPRPSAKITAFANPIWDVAIYVQG